MSRLHSKPPKGPLSTLIAEIDKRAVESMQEILGELTEKAALDVASHTDADGSEESFVMDFAMALTQTVPTANMAAMVAILVTRDAKRLNDIKPSERESNV